MEYSSPWLSMVVCVLRHKNLNQPLTILHGQFLAKNILLKEEMEQQQPIEAFAYT